MIDSADLTQTLDEIKSRIKDEKIMPSDLAERLTSDIDQVFGLLDEELLR